MPFHWSVSIPPENIRKSEVFSCFQGVQNNSSMKWINATNLSNKLRQLKKINFTSCFVFTVVYQALVHQREVSSNFCPKLLQKQSIESQYHSRYPFLRYYFILKEILNCCCIFVVGAIINVGCAIVNSVVLGFFIYPAGIQSKSIMETLE